MTTITNRRQRAIAIRERILDLLDEWAWGEHRYKGPLQEDLDSLATEMRLEGLTARRLQDLDGPQEWEMEPLHMRPWQSWTRKDYPRSALCDCGHRAYTHRWQDGRLWVCEETVDDGERPCPCESFTMSRVPNVYDLEL